MTMDPIGIDPTEVYVTPSGVTFTGAYIDALLKPGTAVRFVAPCDDGGALVTERLEFTPASAAAHGEN